jgi:hypothetical protein
MLEKKILHYFLILFFIHEQTGWKKLSKLVWIFSKRTMFLLTMFFGEQG